MSAPARPHARRRRRGRARGQRGIALIAVITAVAICLVIVNDFGTKTSIDTLQSRNNLDQMRAHFLARSALNLTDIIVRLQDQIDKSADAGGPMAQVFQGVQITDFADPLMAAFGGDAEQVEGAIGFSANDAKGLGADVGTFGVRLTPIDGKININCVSDVNERNLVGAALQSLLYPPAYDPLFEEPDAEGWRRDRKAQVTAIIDYIDQDAFKVDIKPDSTIETTAAPEDYGYETLRDPYKPKNRKIDSVAELKLVRGVDDRFWTLFGTAFRVHGSGSGSTSNGGNGCKVNIRSLDDVKVAAALLSLGATDPNDPILRDPALLWAFANLIIQAKQYGVFLTTADLVDFAKDPRAKLEGLASDPNNPAAAANAASGSSTPFPMPNLPPGVTGIVLDQQKLDKVATGGAVRVYEVEAWSELTRPPFLPIRRTMRAVWDQQAPLLDARTPLTNKGSWQYLREE